MVKRISVLLIILAVLLLLIYSRQDFIENEKEYWMVCSNHSGMINESIYLCNDSTFYTKIMGKDYLGNYSIAGDTLKFSDFSINLYLCKSYILEMHESRKIGSAFPLSCDVTERLSLNLVNGTIGKKNNVVGVPK